MNAYIPPVTQAQTLKAYVVRVAPVKRYGQFEVEILYGTPKRGFIAKEKRVVFLPEFPKVGEIITVQVFD